MRHATGAWCGMTLRAMSRQQKVCLKQKKVLLMLLYWYELIPFYQRTSWIIFKIYFSRSCLASWVTKQTCFGNFTHSQTHFDCPNPLVSVRLHHWIIWVSRWVANKYLNKLLIMALDMMFDIRWTFIHPE